MRLFLSGPFFNDEEVERIDRVKSSLESLGFEVYSTSHRNPPIDLDSRVQKSRRFKLLCKEISRSDGVFAVLDGRDAGTIWEMGYAFALGKPVAAFAEQDRYYSLMIDSSAQFVDGFDELDQGLIDLYRARKPKKGVGLTGTPHE